MKDNKKIEFQITILGSENEFWIETSKNIDTELLTLILKDALFAVGSEKKSKKKSKKTTKKGKKKQ